ncbi:hypothetical protein PoB_003762400 [Plakobranchus ocellatus]|uniref:Uncharacterized protein n=1 Tax=Plakobranchus ocellatus TaxID=259542 RepID=A0AAV4ATJ3_9GAST|nr:hypothetical protein PoB_003762400 [Plakobranchus ocellatus]
MYGKANITQNAGRRCDKLTCTFISSATTERTYTSIRSLNLVSFHQNITARGGGGRRWLSGYRVRPEVCRDPSVAGSSPATNALAWRRA